MKTAPRRMFLIPAGDRLVRKYHDPKGHLAAEGEFCPKIAEWYRAIKSGDVFEGEPPKASKPKPKSRSKKG